MIPMFPPPPLQAGVGRYLAERGLDPAFLQYLVAAQQDKERREYAAWLKRMDQFVA